MRSSRFRHCLAPWCLGFACLIYTLSAGAGQNPGLSLDMAVRRALATHPEIHLYQARFKAAQARVEVAQLRPPIELGFEAENILGSGPLRGLDSAELTVSLSSVIELGQQRSARTKVAKTQSVLLRSEQQIQALEILGDVTDLFIRSLALQENLKVAQDAVQLAQTTLSIVDQRVRKGAAPEAEKLRAQAALTHAKIRLDRSEAEYTSKKYALALITDMNPAEIVFLEGDLFQLSQADHFQTLFERVVRSPMIEVIAGEAQLMAAQADLVRSEFSGVIRWSLGARHFFDTDDTALAAGMSVPLFSESRRRGELRAINERKNSLHSQKESRLLSLRSSLYQAWSTHQNAVSATKRLQADVLPPLEQALIQTRDAYKNGRYGYLDWVGVQHELLEARRSVIAAARTALLSQSTIEQYTATPLHLDNDVAANR